MGTFLKDLGNQLKALRENKKLSQRAMAKVIGIPQSRISKIEHGHVNFSAHVLFQLVRSLEHELMFIPRQEIRTIEAILETKEKSESDWPTHAYTPDKD